MLSFHIIFAQTIHLSLRNPRQTISFILHVTVFIYLYSTYTNSRNFMNYLGISLTGAEHISQLYIFINYLLLLFYLHIICDSWK